MRFTKNIIIISLSLLLLLVFVAVIIPMAKKISKPPAAPIKGKIAIVIDDWGYRADTLDIARQIKYPLTCAVLPNLKYSKAASQKLHGFGFEIILHLPMEPKEKYRLEKNTVTLSSPPERIKKIISLDLESVDFVKGVSNHMGSRVTEDKAASAAVLKEIGQRNLYFLDSVTAKSVAFSLARKMGIRAAKRDIFLDNTDNPEYISGQLNKLKLIARARGWAIGIGHDRKNTLLVLKDSLSKLEQEGYKFVFVSELAK